VADILPLFPLGRVLLPGAPLPLRIFEPRYRALLADVTTPGAGNCFGVVALTAGIEVDTALVRPSTRLAPVGTVAEILEVQPGRDGTATLLAVGSRRFRLGAAVTGEPYLQAEVEYLDELTGPMPETAPDSARALALEYLRLCSELTGAEVVPDPYPRDPVALSYRIAQEAPLDPADLQSLLAEPTAAARLARLIRTLRREVVLLRRTRSIAVGPGELDLAVRPN
jgi:hypothetical protein